MNRSYSELRRLQTFEERYRYLALRGEVGFSTFGFDRHLNQRFYNSREWRQVRHHVIARDNACDLGDPDHEITNRVVIHHMNPIGVDDLVHGDDSIIDPEFLITTTHDTHNAIHYGDESLLAKPFKERRPGDTSLW